MNAKKYSSYLLSGLFLLLSGCATDPVPEAPAPQQLPVQGTVQDTEQDSTEPPAQESQSLPPPREEIVYGSFPEDILARVIIAELAGQRGFNQTALEEYVKLARDTEDLGIIRRASRIATFLRDTEASLELSQLWLAQEPESEEALRTQAFQLITANRLSEALDLFARMHALGYEVDYRLISNRSENNIEIQAQLDELIADFETIQVQYPQDVSLRLALAQLYRENGQLQQAYELLNQLTQELNNPIDILIAEIGVLEEMGEIRQARRRLQDSIDNYPDNSQLRFAYGRKLVEEGNYREAMEQFEIIVEQNPRDFDMLYSLALIAIEANQLTAAKNYLERLLVNGQRSDDVHYYLALINDEQSNPGQAIEHYLQVNGGNNYLVALRNYAELMIEQGRYPEASERLRGIRFRRPELNSTLLVIEGSLLLDSQDYDEAMSFLNRAIGNYPADTQLLQLRSLVAQENNDIPRMEADLREIMRLEPNNPTAFNSLGYYLADRTDRYEEAYELILRAAELSPNDPAIIDSLGWIQYKLGMYEEARINLERAFELYPDHEVAAHLGEVLWVLGNRDAAREIWQDALEVQPDSEFILNTMERLRNDSSS
ncbi:MAG: hypothetical protein CMP91_11230 [Gammaproteobacteria bacterium]|nr:hypothetical protein [Gammaproteobacteria bacterium]|tara:strand:+ start:20177 stop:21982 length:1806 start_codon:yes stop_codon:yes gene_type:complete